MRLSGTKANSTNQYRGLGDQLYDLGGARPTLDLNFANNESLVDSITGKNLVTHTRASSATYVDGDGLIKTAVTNLLTNSEDITASGWNTYYNTSGTASAPVVTANYGTAPDGTQTADRLQLNKGAGTTSSDNTNISNSSYSTIAGQPYTQSAYLKTVDGSTKILRFSFNGEAAVLITVTGDWQRFTATDASASDTSRSLRLSLRGTTGTSDSADVLVWGFQAEQASTAGEYVKTTSTINSAPRFDHDPVTGESLGLLVEEARTNLLPQSNLSGSGALANITRTLTPEINPAGEAETRRFQCNAGTAANRISIGSSSANTVTVSAFVKKDTHRYVNIGYGGLSNSFSALFDIEPGLTSDRLLGQGTKGGASNTNISAGYQDYPNNWVRIWATGTTTGTNGYSLQLAENATAFSLNNWTANGTEAIYVWGGQFEDDAAFPTSLIHTDGAAVTRAADVTEITGNDFGTFNLVEYSEEFDQWNNTGPAEVKPNQALAPNGTFTADELDYTSGSGVPYLTKTIPVSTPTSFSFSLYVKTNDADSTVIRVREGSGVTHNTRLNIDLSANSVTTIDQGAFSTLSSSMTAVGNGWYRVSASIAVDTNTLSSYTSVRYEIYYDAFANISSDQGSFYLWGAQLEESSTLTPYVKSDVTFTSRASTATYYDYNGVIRTAAVDEARNVAFLPDGVTGNFVSAGELLLEEASTNLVKESEDFLNFWSPDIEFTFSKTESAPDGTNNATKFTPTTTSSLKRQKISCVVSNLGPHTFSVYAKAAGYNNIELQVNAQTFNPGSSNIRARYELDTETAVITVPGTNTTASIENVGNGWYRCSYTSDALVVTNAACQVRVNNGTSSTFAGDGTSGVIFWGAQFEEGSYATSYIPTFGAEVTRAADVSSSSSNTLGNSFYDQTKSSVFVDYHKPFNGNWPSYEPFFRVKDTKSPYDFITFGNTNGAGNTNSVYWTSSVGGSNQLDYKQYSAGNSGFYRHAIAITTDDGAFSYAGDVSTRTDNSITMPSSLNKAEIMELNCHIKRIAYWPERLTNDLLDNMTN